MSKSENDVLRDDAKANLDNCFIHRVENVVGDGTPDVFFCIDGVSGWYEGKYARKIPVRLDTAVFGSSEHPLLNTQENWLYRYCVENRGLAWIFARIDNFHVLVPGSKSLDFNKMRLIDFDPYRIQLDMMRYHLIHPQSLGWNR